MQTRRMVTSQRQATGLKSTRQVEYQGRTIQIRTRDAVRAQGLTIPSLIYLRV